MTKYILVSGGVIVRCPDDDGLGRKSRVRCADHVLIERNRERDHSFQHGAVVQDIGAKCHGWAESHTKALAALMVVLAIKIDPSAAFLLQAPDTGADGYQISESAWACAWHAGSCLRGTDIDAGTMAPTEHGECFGTVQFLRVVRQC
jgi:hypothetical protein